MAQDVKRQLDGVVIGILLGFDDEGQPLVVFAGNEQETAIAARTTVQLGPDAVGADVALMFEGGDPERPLLIGRIQQPPAVDEPEPVKNDEASRDYLRFEAGRGIELRCGKSSLILTRAGKILLRGRYILSRSSGVNKIKGGSVHLN